jgi:hypothetical protein
MKPSCPLLTLLFPVILFLALPVVAVACEACRAQTPRLIRGLGHGGGPQGFADYAAVLITLGVVVYALGHTLRCWARPGETDAAHIKRTILRED